VKDYSADSLSDRLRQHSTGRFRISRWARPAKDKVERRNQKDLRRSHRHRRSRGAMGAHPPPGRRIKCRRNLQGKFVSAPPAHRSAPQAEHESIFGHFFWAGKDLEVGVVHLVVLDRRLLRATTKKGRQLF